MRRLWEKLRKEPDKWTLYLWLAAFGASLVPLLYLARYAVPGCDDYTYGIATHGAWIADHSLLSVLKAAFATTVEYWRRWQGTYASIFLMTLSPGILDERWYFLTTFLMAGMLCVSLGVLLRVVLKGYVCGADAAAGGVRPGKEAKDQSRRIALCTLVLLFLSLQTMVAPSDGLYWYNGALHYVFMESVLFFQAAVLLQFCRSQGRGRAVWFGLSVLLAAVLGGANLLTGLQSCILTAFLAAYVLWKKKGSWRFFLLLVGCVNLAGFALNVLAPGNAVRETTAEGMGAFRAIVLSFYWAAVFVTEWMTPIVLAGFLLLLPVVWKLVSGSGARFFWPPAALLVSYCVFAAMFTPTLFATSSEGPDRCKNVMRIVLYLLAFLNLVNTLGWLKSNREKGLPCRLLDMAQEGYAVWLLCASLAVGLLFLLPADKNRYTSISALRSLANGEAARYYEENERRIALYRDRSLPDVTIEPLTARPYLLFKEDVGNEGSPDYWINISIVDYYQKNSVTVTETVQAEE